MLRANEAKCISKMRNTLDNATFDNTKRLNVTITVTSWRTPKTPKPFLVSVVSETLLGLKVAFIKSNKYYIASKIRGAYRYLLWPYSNDVTFIPSDTINFILKYPYYCDHHRQQKPISNL